MRAPVFALALLAVTGISAHAGSIEINRSADGHWRAEGRVNGRPVTFLIDTGATVVALTGDDARKAGIDVHHLSYTQSVMTAGGPARAATVMLERVQLGNVRLDNVQAMVIEKGLNISLLGQSFLGRLDRMQTRGASLRLED